MKWREGYLDMILVPSGLLLCIMYHVWLWQKVRSQPQNTDIGINSSAQRRWVIAMMKENGTKYMLVVQTIRNAIMSSTLMATTSILLCTGLAAILSSTYSVKKPLQSSLYGAHGELIVAFKFMSLLFIFLLSFLCYTISIRIMNQLNFLINIPNIGFGYDEDEASPVTTMDYVCGLFERSFLLQIVGNRLFYAAIPLLLWIFGPCFVVLCYVIMVPIMYDTDIVRTDGKGNSGNKAEQHKIYMGV